MGLFAQDMKVSPNTKITINTGTQLNFNNSGNLLLKDNPTSAPSFLQDGLVNFSGGGQAKVEQYLTKDKWNLVSSPANNSTIGAYNWMYLYSYNEPDNSWTSLSQPTTLLLNAGQGYFVWPYTSDPNGSNPPSPDLAILTGNLNYQDINLTLSNTASSSNSGWNLVGNPFPCALNWNGDASWNLNNVGAAMYIMDPSSGNYEVWNYNSGGTNPNGGYIAATQGFWVRAADTTGPPASMTIPASQRSHNEAAFYKNSGHLLNNQLLLTLKKEDKADKTIIGFIEDASAGFDGNYDATYLYGSENAHSLYSQILGTKYALNHLPSIEEYPVVPLYFEPRAPGNFTLSADWTESFPDEIPIYLEDVKTGAFLNLREADEYVFIAQLNDEVHRFNIHFTNPLDIENYDALAGVQIYAFDNYINVKLNEDTNGEIRVYNLLGEQIIFTKTKNQNNRIPVSTNNNYLLVKVLTKKGIKTQKIFIK